MAPKRPNLFSTSFQDRDLFPGASSSASGVAELDLRAELDELFYGYESGIRHGHLIVIRHLRRDAVGEAIPCSCRDPFTREGDPDCSYCDGERYLWDEIWYWTYSMYSGADTGLASRLKYMPPASLRIDHRIFFFRYDTPIKYGDKIVEMKLDIGGAAVVPYMRESIYRPQTIQKYRSDNGRLEYFAIYCREESAIRSENPE
jgi:hypothetical protein